MELPEVAAGSGRAICIARRAGLYGSSSLFHGGKPDNIKHLEILVPDAGRSDFSSADERLVPAPVHEHGWFVYLQPALFVRRAILKRLKKILFLALMVAALSCLFCQPAFAISEEEVQAQVDAVGKEAVSGNVLIWFMCAIGFLKVSQKVDSFMASLGVNVGHTGGSMLAEAMIAARGFSGFKSFASNHFAGGRSSHSSHVRANGGGKGGAGFGAGFASGGLAGVIKRNVTNNAVKTATTPPDAKPSGLSGLVGGAAGGIGGHIYASSVSKGGNFANNVIGSVATGSITQMGTMTGDKAVEALHSYMGHAALEPGAENIPTYQNVEIGGGRITGTEVTPEHPEGIAFGMYHADQYVAPEGQYTTVHAVDGTAWYKQYAADAVEKSPYMAPDGSIAYHESIVKKLPPTPKRKDKL